MSLKTWKKEFYPVEASEMADKSDVKCIEHSLRKWEGALKKNTKKHEVEYVNHEVRKTRYDSECLEFRGVSCALCRKHSRNADCGECPLVAANGGKRCDAPGRSVYANSSNDPRPMIRLLKKALKMAKGAK